MVRRSLYLALIVLSVSCGGVGYGGTVLAQVDTMLHDGRCDSAYAMVQTLDGSKFDNASSGALYALLYTKAQHKNYVPIKNDSLIRIAVDYYRAGGAGDRYSQSLYYLGAALQDGRDWDAAIEAYKQAEALFEDAHEPLMLALVNSCLGQLYSKQYFPDKALDRYRKSAQLFEQIGDERNLCRLYGYISTAYGMSAKSDSAQQCLYRAIDIARRLQDTVHISRLQCNISWFDLYEKKSDRAKNAMLDLIDRYQEGEVQPFQRHLMASIYFEHLQLDSALHYLIQGDTMSLSENNLASRIFAAKGDYQMALQYFMKYSDAAISKFDRREGQRVDEIEAKYDKRRVIIEKEYADKRFILWVLISALTTIILSLLVFGLVLRKRKLEREHKQLIEILKDQELSLQTTNSALDTMLNTRSEQELLLRSAIDDRIAVIRELIDMSYECGDNYRLFANRFHKAIMTNPFGSGSLDELLLQVDRNYDGIITYLKTTYPTLNRSDLEVCALTYLGFTSLQLFIVLGAANVDFIYRKKHKIGVKMGMRGDLKTNLNSTSIFLRTEKNI